MYLLSKTAWFILQPLHLSLIACALGLLLTAFRFFRSGTTLSAIGLGSLYIITFTPLGLALLQPLEDCLRQKPLPKHVDGILILGGGIDWYIANERRRLELSAAADRLMVAAELARQNPNARLVYTGFNPEGQAGMDIHALLVDTLASMGIVRENIIVEDQSRNTFENIKLSKALLRPADGEVWIAVTSAFHMRRTMSILQTFDWPAIPWPVDYRSPAANSAKPFFKDSIDYIHNVNIATKEWLGLFVYRLTGRIGAISSCDA